MIFDAVLKHVFDILTYFDLFLMWPSSKNHQTRSQSLRFLPLPKLRPCHDLGVWKISFHQHIAIFRVYMCKIRFLYAKRPHAHVAKRQEPQGKADDFQSIVKQAKFLYGLVRMVKATKQYGWTWMLWCVYRFYMIYTHASVLQWLMSSIQLLAGAGGREWGNDP